MEQFFIKVWDIYNFYPELTILFSYFLLVAYIIFIDLGDYCRPHIKRTFPHLSHDFGF